MVMLTVESLKNALLYVRDNSTTISYYARGTKKDLINTDGLEEDQAYHIRVVELLNPPLITKLSESYITLSLAGQELLDILSDSAYLESLTEYLKKQGYSNPSDRQVFRLVCERMSGEANVSWSDIVRDIVSDLSYKPTKETLSAEVVDVEPIPEIEKDKSFEDIPIIPTEPVIQTEVPVAQTMVQKLRDDMAAA